MGRNVGWVAAATAFARCYPDDAPHLIYCPERPLPKTKLLSDIEAVYRRLGRVFVCICEGQLDENGEPFGADLDRPDNPQHRLASNLAHAVAKFVSKELRLRVRSERPSLLGRSSSAYASDVDRREAELCGREAVRAALRGETGKMVALQRGSGARYACTATLVPLEKVARKERPLPPEFVAESGRDITTQFLEYADPLVGDVRCFPRLR
jgi:6-phosphofructokinase 1